MSNKYIYKNDIYYPLNINQNNINLSYKGLDTESFTITNNSNNFGLDTHILFEQKAGDTPEVMLSLKINETTSQIFHFSDITEPSNNSIYHIIYDPNLLVYNNSNKTAGIVEYTWQDDRFIFNSIVNSGLFDSNTCAIDTLLYNMYNTFNFNITNENFNLEYDNRYKSIPNSPSDIGSTIACAVDSISISSGGAGYKLGSTFYLGRSNLTNDYFNPDCILDVELGLCDSTVIISGGSNYKVGETFIVTGADTPGFIEINEVDDSGAIISASISIESAGINFTTMPVVTYEGQDGEGADIEINDRFCILDSVTIIDSGNAYTIYDTEILASYNDSFYEVSVPASCLTTLENIKLTPIVTDNFSLSDSVTIINSGNNITDNNFQLISKNSVINNTYIDINLDYLIDNPYNEFKVRPRFYY